MQNSKDYSQYAVIMISTDRLIFEEGSSVRMRMIEYAKLYKELHIIIFSYKKMKPVQIASNCTIYSTNSFIRWDYVRDARTIGKGIINQINKDLPLLVSCQNPFETALAGKCLTALRRNSELLIQIHTDLYSPYFSKHSFVNKINLFISRFTLPHAQIIRVVSQRIADSLIVRGFDSMKIIIAPITVSVNDIKNTPPSFDLHAKYPQFKKIILMVSRLETEKNIPHAFRILKNLNAEVGLIIVGDGSLLESLKKQAVTLNIESRVIFVGWQKDIISYYKGCDIFLCTSSYEGYAMVLKEAEAAGCRIISTDVGIAREVGAEIITSDTQTIIV